MESSAVDRVCQSVYRQFPEFKGIRPSVRSAGTQYLLIFTVKVKTADGKSLPRTVRATANEEGNIVKISTSR
ncbi:MAG: hypothetical protein AB9897_09265 [Anaerolineaceae bacterium]